MGAAERQHDVDAQDAVQQRREAAQRVLEARKRRTVAGPAGSAASEARGDGEALVRRRGRRDARDRGQHVRRGR